MMTILPHNLCNAGRKIKLHSKEDPLSNNILLLNCTCKIVVFGLRAAKASLQMDGTKDTQKALSSGCFRCLCSHVFLNKQKLG